MSDIYQVLQQLNIDYVKREHVAVFTVGQAKAAGYDGSGYTKNLFLRNKKGDHHYLVAILSGKRVDLKALAQSLGEAKLSFASSERLKKHLGLTPGSVSLLGLINDTEKQVQVIIDIELWQSDLICCHPNINTATLEIKREDLEKFFDYTGHEVEFVDI